MRSNYDKIISKLFFAKYRDGDNEIDFTKEDLEKLNAAYNIRNLPDVLYHFRSRYPLPKKIRDSAKNNCEWIIRATGEYGGTAHYKFIQFPILDLTPNKSLIETKILNSTPGVIDKYALNNEQALLAKIRYNRIIDIFTGATCYSLQNHLRTKIKDIGQVEIDEVYVGIDQRGAHYIIPVEAKGEKDKIGRIQIEQYFAFGETKFPNMICRPLAAQFLKDDVIVIFSFTKHEDQIRIIFEKHYLLVSKNELSLKEIAEYSRQSLSSIL
ncbi:MAG: endonuclease [Candidatus Glassbacteria bacterium]|nr:endonuclease [Candidatus Glassbacteria bacterium]